MIKKAKPDIAPTWLRQANPGGLAAAPARVPAVAWAMRPGALSDAQDRMRERAIVSSDTPFAPSFEESFGAFDEFPSSPQSGRTVTENFEIAHIIWRHMAFDDRFHKDAIQRHAGSQFR
jgi:hypothetical protein